MSDNIKSIISLRRDVKRLKEAVVALGRRGVAGEAPEAVQLDEFSITVYPQVNVFLEPTTSSSTSYRWNRRLSTYYTLNGLEDPTDKSSYGLEFNLDATRAPNLNAIVTDDHDGLITITGQEDFNVPQLVQLTIKATRNADGATATGEITFLCRYRTAIGLPTPATPVAPEPETVKKEATREILVDTTGIRDSWGAQFTLTPNSPYIIGGHRLLLRRSRGYAFTLNLPPLFTASDRPSRVVFGFNKAPAQKSYRSPGLEAEVSTNGVLTVRDTGTYGWEGVRRIPIHIRAQTTFNSGRFSNWAVLDFDLNVVTEKPLRPVSTSPPLELRESSIYTRDYGLHNRVEVVLNTIKPEGQPRRLDGGQPTKSVRLDNLWAANMPKSTLSQIRYTQAQQWGSLGEIRSTINTRNGGTYLDVRHIRPKALPTNGLAVLVTISAVRSYGGTPPVVSSDSITLYIVFRTFNRNRYTGGWTGTTHGNTLATLRELGYIPS